MRVRRVNRYYCDFCKKAGGSVFHLRNHEERCTLNPNRICGMCKLMENTQPSLAILIAALPNPDNFKDTRTDSDIWNETLTDLEKVVQVAVPALRRLAGNCPACMLAALRQAKIPVPIAREFDYAAESKSIRSDYYEEQAADKYEYV